MCKNIYLTAILCLLCGGLAFGAGPLRHDVHSGWKFKQARLTEWYPAVVPGVVHLDLMNNGLIEDPYYGLNERGMQWIDKEDWIYETTLEVPAELASRQNVVLRFEGLDTFADVYLNGEKIIAADNMFREWTADIGHCLKPEGNTLTVYFHTPTGTALRKYLAAPFPYLSNNDQSYNGGFFDMTVSMFARKAGYHFGWDWGPRLATSGIWRPVYLEAWDEVRIDDVYIRQKEVNAAKADLSAETTVSAAGAMKGVKITIKDAASGKTYASHTADLVEGENMVDLGFCVRNPKLWWSNGLGDQNLYTFRTEITHNGKLIGRRDVTTGLRSLRLVREDDEEGRSFYFELNGRRVFAKGANYIPCDVFLPRVTDSIRYRTLSDAANTNMNMIRIWGGGIYEENSFYEMCDRLGLMVWHDFQFACAIYPAEGEFLENIRQEALHNVRRLRNHPSIAVWCGNNEVQECWFSEWGNWQGRYTPEQRNTIWEKHNQYLFDKVLRGIVEENTENTPYTPTSPFSRYDGVAQGAGGDLHFWEVWFALQPVETYNVHRARFFSEYGFQSFPTMETIRTFIRGPEDCDPFSEVMMFHQRSSVKSNWMMSEYIRRELREPKDFPSFVYSSHVMQAHAVKTAIEAHRRDMDYCGGTLFWQHNDCWPAVSWSSRDYYGRWKALQYWAAEAYRDILVSPIAEEGRLNIYIVSDRLAEAPGKLSVEIMTFDGKTVAASAENVVARANSSHIAWSAAVDELLNGRAAQDVLVRASFEDNLGTVYANNYLFVPLGKADLPAAELTLEVRPAASGFEISVGSDNFAKAVYLSAGSDVFFSDNYFDILPGKRVKLFAETALSIDDFKERLAAISLADSY